MPQGAVVVKLLALITARNECDLDAVVGHVAAMEAEARVCFGPAIGELSGVAGGLGAVEVDAVDDLNRTSGVDVAAEEDVESSSLEELTELIEFGKREE